jgi:AcrR family transcriptional regulator
MSRVTPSDRIPKLLDAAAAAFVEHGFQRTQMDDVAERLGVSKGTIYRTVDSKEALFAAVVEWGGDPDRVPAPGVNGAVNLATVAAAVTAQLAAAVGALELTTIVATRPRLNAAEGFGEEVERVVIGLHRLMHNRRTTVMVLDRCASEIPEIAAVWFVDGRYALVDLWTNYLELRSSHVTIDVDRVVVARTIVEMITTWAVKMPWDRAPRPYPSDTATECAAMIRHLLMGPPQ